MLCKTATGSGKDYVKAIVTEKPLPTIDIHDDMRGEPITADEIPF